MADTSNATEVDRGSAGLAALDDAGIDTDGPTPKRLEPAVRVCGGGCGVTARPGA